MAASADSQPAARQQTHPEPGGFILRSKITVPGLPDWAVPRPRLDQLIDEGTRGTLTTLVGPPGTGKTLAMAAWAAASRRPRPVAWVTVDEFDNRPRILWTHVLAALRQAGAAVPPLSWAADRAGPVDHVFLVRLTTALAGQDPPAVLVLDDIHLLTEPAALRGLSYLLRNAQPGLHVLAASRMDPLLPLHRFRLAGDLAEIRTGDLAFSVAESGLLMAQHGIALPPDSLASLTGRAEGWAAGLRLAAISMAGHPDPQQFVKEFAAEDSPVAGYLVDEALNTQPPQMRDLLLRMSILDSFGAEIANELSDEHTGNALAQLVRTNAFVQPAGGGWYRYHALFADVLRLKLRHESPCLVPELHRRAAGWYRQHGALGQAVRHAARAGDWRLAARIVVDDMAVGQLIEPHGDHPLADEFAQLPYQQTWRWPEPLLVAAAMELGRDHPGGTWLHAAEAMLGRLPAGEAVPARLAAAQVRFAEARRAGDLESLAAAAAQTEVLLESVPAAALARCPWLRVQAMAARGTVQLWSGRLPEAAVTLEAGAAAAQDPASGRERASCLGSLALADVLLGRLNRAAGAAAAAASTGDSSQPPPVSPAAQVALAAVHLERNELRQARGQLKRAAAALHRYPDRLTRAVAWIVAARKALAEGQPDEARDLLGRARAGWRLPPWLQRRVVLLESRAFVAAGNIAAAVDAAGRAGPGTLAAAVALAQARLAGGEPLAAREVLAGHHERTQPVPDHVRLEGWLTVARLSYGSGDRAGGRRSLQRALRLGEPERLRLPFVLERSWLRRELRADPDLAHVYRDLLEPDLVSPAGEPAQRPGESPAAPVMIEQLSNREEEVLRQAAQMLDTTEIAAQLYISVNTVKSHLKSIYRKLAVTHRSEAVRRARQLEIL
jgi:LuxR family transcriptional regulator, maltose regulon positive regulatory protein